jgi:hypothetical protein
LFGVTFSYRLFGCGIWLTYCSNLARIIYRLGHANDSPVHTFLIIAANCPGWGSYHSLDPCPVLSRRKCTPCFVVTMWCQSDKPFGDLTRFRIHVTLFICATHLSHSQQRPIGSRCASVIFGIANCSDSPRTVSYQETQVIGCALLGPFFLLPGVDWWLQRSTF